ncbi:MAG: NusG domain II-containing protein [Bacillota bacterium]|nr:NusG domain II-containing protein [Bacillota bacterium]HOC06110.1 NusG domain II-containing protein [Bacillota bacterium]HPZ21582.1 NusG domain II-containing protein [Bacillota bacterium]HQD19477.1 NusG domain II-containing protein [Bacillota bacterium]
MKRGDILIVIILTAVVLAGGYLYFFHRSTQGTIVVEVDGKTTNTFPLFQEGRDEIIDVRGVNGTTKVQLQDGRVRVIESACPDKICVGTGWLRSSTGAIVCLPNRVVITIVDYQDKDIDLR